MTRRTIAALAVLALPASALLTGCVGYGSWPPVEGADLAATNPNVPYAVETMALGLRWVLQRYPVPGTGTEPVPEDEARFAVNVPAGIRRANYIKIASAPGGTPATAENVGALPVYHIGRVWIRGGKATVDVLRPMFEYPARGDGSPVYQCVTVHMEGGFQPWRVAGTQTREPGVVPVPDYYFLPETEFPDHEERIRQSRQPASSEPRVVETPTGGPGQ